MAGRRCSATLDDRQFGMGYGALLVAGAFLFLFTLGLAGRGAVGGDVFVVGSIGFVVAVVAIFIFMPILQMLASALVTQEGGVFAVDLSRKAVQRAAVGPRLPRRRQRAAALPGTRCSWPCWSAC